MTTSNDLFHAVVKDIEGRSDYHRPAAFALGLARFSADPGRAATTVSPARVLDTYYPVTNLGENFGSAAVLASVTGYRSGSCTIKLTAQQIEQALTVLAPFKADGKPHLNITALEDLRDAVAYPDAVGHGFHSQAAVVTFIGDLAQKPHDAHDVYLRLHLLSQRKVKPHSLSLEGAFGLLNNVVWTNSGPFEPDAFDLVRLHVRKRGLELKVSSVDKFPRMTDYVMPSGVRIADADRVRLGAHLAEGTVVMHEGFVNFNAGTLGKSMVEGRISAGVVVGAGSDIGGGASIMGTLSGGGKVVIAIGENCLLGANSGCGISLGDGSTIEAGLYVTAGSKVRLPDGRLVKAGQLSGSPDLLYRRNSQNGAIEVIAKKNEVRLNASLH
jgi:2,3,4,5-tetrahydropyridine-2,6-dicarboxylate N-succinyltransferase